MKKKVFATMLTAMMVCSMAGCGGTNNTAESQPQADSSAAASSETASAEEGSQAPVAEFTYPMKEVTLTVNMDKNPYDMTDYPYIEPEYYFWNVLKENTGVTLVNDGPTPQAYTFEEDYMLMLISGDLPDLLWGNWVEYAGGPGQAIQDGYIIALNDYEEYMPNLMAYLDANPDIKSMVTLDDGTLYCFPFIRDEGMQTETGAAIRQDWLDEQNLEVPTTIEEWHDVLTKLKSAYNLSAPLTFESRWLFNEYALSSLSSAYNTTYPFYVDNGTVYFGPLEDGYKDFITELSKWYAEGLIDPDMPTVDKSTVTSKLASGEAAIAINQLSKVTSCMSSNEGTSYDLSAVPTAVMNKGETPKMSHYRNTYDGSYSISISTSCKDIESACRFMDYMYSEEGSRLLNYGTEGVSYEVAADGTISFTDIILKNEDVSASSARNSYGHYNNWAMVEQQYSLQLDDKTREVQEGWYANMSEYAYPTVNYTTEEREVLSAYWTDIDDYCREMILKFVIGSESLDNWDSFVKQLEDYHIDDVLKVKQAAYDRYSSK